MSIKYYLLLGTTSSNTSDTTKVIRSSTIPSGSPERNLFIYLITPTTIVILALVGIIIAMAICKFKFLLIIEVNIFCITHRYHFLKKENRKVSGTNFTNHNMGK